MIIPDILLFSGQQISEEEQANYVSLYTAFKLRHRQLLRQRLQQIMTNAEYYKTKVKQSAGGDKLTFKKALKNAMIVPAHPSRYNKDQLNSDNIIGFVVHRPGTDPKAATLENIIIEFCQSNAGRTGRTGLTPATHFVIGQQGELIQMVDLVDMTAHAGGLFSTSEKKVEVNYSFVGAELEGHIGAPISNQCYNRLAELIVQLSNIFPNMILDSTHIVEHRELPERVGVVKLDVGAPFNKEYLLKLVDEKKKVISNVETVSYNLDEIQESLAETIIRLAAFGNAVKGFTEEQINVLHAETKKYIRKQKQLSLESHVGILDNFQDQQNFLWEQYNNMNNILTEPRPPIPVTNGVTLSFEDGDLEVA